MEEEESAATAGALSLFLCLLSLSLSLSFWQGTDMQGPQTDVLWNTSLQTALGAVKADV
jgi:hypothetical protein